MASFKRLCVIATCHLLLLSASCVLCQKNELIRGNRQDVRANTYDPFQSFRNGNDLSEDDEIAAADAITLQFSLVRRDLQLTYADGVRDVYSRRGKGGKGKGKGWSGKGRSGKGRSGKGKGWNGKGRSGKGRSGKGRRGKGRSRSSPSKSKSKSKSTKTSSADRKSYWSYSSSKSKKKRKSSRSAASRKYKQSRKYRKKKSEIFKKEDDSSSRSKSKKKKATTKDTKRSYDKSKKKKSGDGQLCKSKEQTECRDVCINEKCQFAGNRMCVKKCKMDCCGESLPTISPAPTPTPKSDQAEQPVSAPEPTTLQPVLPSTDESSGDESNSSSPARSCSEDLIPLTGPGALECQEGGCCVVSDAETELCNNLALSTFGEVAIVDGEIIASNIDTTPAGPFPIDEGCPIACSTKCRLAPGSGAPTSAPPPELRSFLGPGTIDCIDGYCETVDTTNCNYDGLVVSGDLTIRGGTIFVRNMNTREPLVINDGCEISCTDACQYQRPA